MDRMFDDISEYAGCVTKAEPIAAKASDPYRP